MAIKYVITSGKGGVGKTTLTANIGLKLAELGKRVAVVDGDLGLNNLDVLTGVEDKSTFDLSDVVSGRCRAKQALVESPLNKNLFVLPSAHTLTSPEISGQGIKNAIDCMMIESPLNDKIPEVIIIEPFVMSCERIFAPCVTSKIP